MEGISIGGLEGAEEEARGCYGVARWVIGWACAVVGGVSSGRMRLGRMSFRKRWGGIHVFDFLFFWL